MFGLRCAIKYRLGFKQDTGHLSMEEYYREALRRGPIERDGHLLDVVDFIVAPKEGLYEVDELNKFMLTLISDKPYPIKPFSKKLFSKKEDRLEFGSLTFIDGGVAEERNKYKRVIRLNPEKTVDELLSNPEKYSQNRKRVLKGTNYHVRLDREINVRPFPDERIAAKYQGKDSISLRDLGLYQKMAEIEKTIDNKQAPKAGFQSRGGGSCHGRER